MLTRLVKLLPRSLAVQLWRKMPMSKRFKNTVFWFSNHRFLVAVMGVILDVDGKVLLLHHTYRDHKPWGMPSGMMELEQPAEGLIREVFEETGFQISVERILHVSLNERRIVDIFLLGRITGGEFRPSPEVSDYGFFNIHELPVGLTDHQRLLINKLLVENSLLRT
ncbi:MAG: hypothetical protein JWN30_2131 [Bacilli bacterium]|nr:hypothetical protein [Bacilli bacterium]